LWWTLTKNEGRRLGKRRSLLTDAKWRWCRWLWWTHLFDDEWLENENLIVMKKNRIMKEK
jgi:hypothetical protein